MADNDPTTTPAPPAAPAHPASPVYTVDGEALDVDAARRLSRNYELMKRERARGVRQGGECMPGCWPRPAGAHLAADPVTGTPGRWSTCTRRGSSHLVRRHARHAHIKKS